MQRIKFFFSIFLLILFINCFGLKVQKNDIISNDWKGKSIQIANLEDFYKRKNRFNKVFSKFSSKRFIPYYRFIDKTYNIAGSFNQGDESYIIIKDKNGKFFKISQRSKNYNNDNVPSFIVFEETLENAKLLIDTKIWLNNVWDEENFISKFSKCLSSFPKC